jgi:hypothetical protein
VVAHKVHKVFKVPLEVTVNGTNLVDYAKVVDLSYINITTQVPLAANTFYALLQQAVACYSK